MITDLLGLPPLASEHGADVDKLILYVHWVMGALFVGWLAYFVYVIFRFRQSRNPKANYVGVKSHASSYIEGAVVIAEAVLLIGFAVPLWAKAADQFPPENESTVIRVIAEQFSWGARYPGPDGKFGAQDMSLITRENPLGLVPNDPAGKDDYSADQNHIYVPLARNADGKFRPVICDVTSKDVIHSFKVNPLRVTQDAIPGLSIPVWFRPTKAGEYLINCAQLCGNSHYYMKGYLHIVEEEKFKQ
ncbi:MAG: cytochrome c oxidase subunit II, partial [Verrucomicrobiota bacterium]